MLAGHSGWAMARMIASHPNSGGGVGGVNLYSAQRGQLVGGKQYKKHKGHIGYTKTVIWCKMYFYIVPKATKKKKKCMK